MAIDPAALGTLAETPQRRDRNVRQPGQRGGKWRRVWSPRLKKWYIKYGEAPGGRGGVNVQGNDTSGAPQKNGAQGQNPSFNTGRVSTRKQDEENLLHGIFERLLEAMQIGRTGSGKTRLGRPVSFGDVSPITGEITPHNDQTRFMIYNGDGDKLDDRTEDIGEEKRRHEFICYMVAEYVTHEFLKLKFKKSLVFITKEHDIFSDELYKARTLSILDNVSTMQLPNIVEQNVEPITLLQNNLKKSLSFLKDVNDLGLPLDADEDDLSRLEKASAKDVWLKNAPIAGKRYGHVGSGNKSVYRRPGRPPGTGQGLTVASAGIPRSGIGAVGAESKFDASAPIKVKVSDEDWYRHPDIKVGAMILVHHPYRHKKPTWGRILSTGEHGAMVDCDGNQMMVRWENVHKVIPRVEDTKENVAALIQQGIPMDGVKPLGYQDEDEALKQLRKLQMPFADDVIHDGHEKRDGAYESLFRMEAPIDVIEATIARPIGETKVMGKYKANLINSALEQQLPINATLLEKLPFEKVVEVLHHHLTQKKGST